MTPKPTALPPDFDRVPAALRDRRRWVVWKYEWKENPSDPSKSRWDKPPRDIRTGGLASSTNQGTWSTLDEVRARFEAGGLDGVGVILGDGIAGVDLDGVRDPATGEVDPLAQERLRALDSYTELSPSGRGFHVLMFAPLPGRGRNDREQGVEVYGDGSPRYFTWTGALVEGFPTEPQERTEALRRFYFDLWPPEEEIASVTSPSGAEPPAPVPVPAADLDGLSDEELLRRAANAKNGSNVLRLLQGDTTGYDSPSEADAALLASLAFWVRSPSRLERLFGLSELGKREKWTSRPDYRRRSIDAALRLVTTSYSGKPPAPVAEVLDGPGGLRFRLKASKVTASKTVISLDVLSGDESLPYSVSSLPNPLDDASREMAQVYGIPLQEMKLALRRLIRKVQEAPPKKGDNRSAEEVIRREAANLRPAYRDGIRIWSEELRCLLYRDGFCDALLTLELIKELSKLDEFAEAKLSAVKGSARTLAEAVFTSVLRSLPERADAEKLDGSSRAATEARRTIEEVWHLPRTFERRGDYAEAASLHSRAIEAASQVDDTSTPWNPIHRGYAAWWRLQDGRIELSMAFRLLLQCRAVIPGVHDEASFGRLLEKYGVLQPADRAMDRAGSDRTRVRRLSPDLVDSWAVE